MRVAIYTDTGACNFCQAPTRWGGAPHAPGCAYWQALSDIVDCGQEAVAQAAAMLATERATRLAQRRKAAERIDGWKKEAWDGWNGRWQDGVDTYVLALQDTGILAPDETEKDLLKELESK